MQESDDVEDIGAGLAVFGIDGVNFAADECP